MEVRQTSVGRSERPASDISQRYNPQAEMPRTAVFPPSDPYSLQVPDLEIYNIRGRLAERVLGPLRVNVKA